MIYNQSAIADGDKSVCYSCRRLKEMRHCPNITKMSSILRNIARSLSVNAQKTCPDLPGAGQEVEQEVGEPQILYTHELAVLSKSYIRDIERSYNAYQSFERFFSNKSAPFFIVVPECDVRDFEDLFASGIKKNEISKPPIIMTERQILERANEPVEAALSMGGYYVQQIIKLCFGLTGLARHYMILDPDGFFTRDFDPTYLYRDDVLQYTFHECWHRCRTRHEIDELDEVGHGDSKLIGYGIRFFDASKIIKQALGITVDCFRNYVASPGAFDSSVIQELKLQLVKGGINNFSYAIHIAPFEFQWYGEYLHASRVVLAIPYLFHIVEPSVEVLHIEKDFNEQPGKYGVQYQSVDYENNRETPRVKPVMVYK
jgi:hypothetical protein